MSAETDMSDRDGEENTAPGEGSGAAGAARLRDRIDRGAWGDKVAFRDPAAAPLGTDDEAAGTQPSAAQAATAMRDEATRSAAADRKPGPGDIRDDGSRTRSWLIVAGVVALGATIIAFLVA